MKKKSKTWEKILQERTNRYTKSTSLRNRYQVDFRKRGVVKGKLLYDRVCKCLGGVIPKEFLEVGCGIGDICIWFAKQGVDTLGIDIVQEVVDIGNMRKKEESLNNLNFMHLDISKSTAPRKYSFIMCVDVLEHIKNDADAVKNMALSLREGGHIYLSVPNKFSLFYIFSDPHYHVPFVALMRQKWANVIVSKLLRRHTGVDVQKLYSRSDIKHLCYSVGYNIQVKESNKDQFEENVLTRTTHLRRALKLFCRSKLVKRIFCYVYLSFYVKNHVLLLSVE